MESELKDLLLEVEKLHDKTSLLIGLVVDKLNEVSAQNKDNTWNEFHGSWTIQTAGGYVILRSARKPTNISELSPKLRQLGFSWEQSDKAWKLPLRSVVLVDNFKKAVRNTLSEAIF